MNSFEPQPYTLYSPSPKKKKKSLLQFWKNASVAGKIGILLALLIVVLSACICSLTTAIAMYGIPPTPTTTVIKPTPVMRITTVPTTIPQKIIPPTAVPTATPLPTPTPTALPTATPEVTPTEQPTAQPTSVNGNPWGYDFDSSGSLIYSPPPTFCVYFSCVSSFWKDTNGYVAECSNGLYTHSGGITGACSRDGGVEQALYSHGS